LFGLVVAVTGVLASIVAVARQAPDGKAPSD
jgi:hypothetical protein